MRVNPISGKNENRNQIDPLKFLSPELSVFQNNPHADLIQSLLYEIIRVKEIIKFPKPGLDNSGRTGGNILSDLVSEAYDSLVNYDLILMKKYFDLLQNCD